MLSTITLPLWVFATVVGLPGIGFLWMGIARLRRKRRAARDARSQVPAGGGISDSVPGPNRFARDLIAMQIDTVFNGLTALVEAERIKLNMLLGGQIPVQHMQAPVASIETEDDPEPQDGETVEPPGGRMGRQISRALESGQEVDRVAAQMGLSMAEVDLALKLHQAQDRAPQRRLDAVA